VKGIELKQVLIFGMDSALYVGYKINWLVIAG